MKKFLSIIFALILSVSGVWATASITVGTTALTDASQINTSKYYVLYNVGRSAYVNVNTTTGQVMLSSTLPTTSPA